MNVNFLDECCYLANSWGSGHVLFFFDSYIGEEMSHTWLRGWYHLLMQIMCLDEEWGWGWGREWSRMPLGREHSFLWLSVDCRWQLPTSASTSCWVCDQLCWEVVCVCVCVCVYQSRSVSSQNLKLLYLYGPYCLCGRDYLNVKSDW